MHSEMASNTAINIDEIRKDFPILHQEINGHPLIYLDNAATSQKPKQVIDAITDYYQSYNSNVHRGLHTLSEKATLAFENARSKVQYFINAKNSKEIIFVRGATEAINLVAHSFVLPRIQPGEDILITEMEHHSNIVPWQIVCKKVGANLKVIPINHDGDLILEEFEKLLTPQTKFLALGHISNALGTVNPIKKMIKIAHDHDVRVLIDGAQAGPHTDIDVQDLDADFYVVSGHKMYAPTGIGFLYGKEELLDGMAPYQSGGEMISRVTFENTTFNKLPNKFEAGTPNISGAIALGAAIDYINGIGIHNIAAHEDMLLRYATEQIKQIKGLIIIGTAKEKASILSFLLGKIHAHDVGTILSSQGIAIRAGHHCAMPLMEHFEVAATSRASFAVYNTKKEVDSFIEALQQVKEVFA